MSDELPPKRRKEDISFNSQLKEDADSSVYESLKSAFRSSSHFKDEKASIELLNEPFPCCVIKDFMNDLDSVKQLEREVLSLEFNEKSNDLYKFLQSDDLKDNTLPYISILRDLLYGQFLKWLKDITGIHLNTNVDMSAAQYKYTDTLLCHDDELEDRRIAFIYYLVPSWSKEDGGTLDLFAVNEHGQPSDIVRSLVPVYNSLIFFEVSPVSYHQVAEVLAKDKCRLSISGWFHGPTKARLAPFCEPTPCYQSALEFEDEILIEWVNPLYLNPEVAFSIQEQFEEDAEILLKDFLKEEKYKAIESELTSPHLDWDHHGPPNKRSYDRASNVTSTSTLHDVIKFLGSRPLFKLLTKLTGLELAEIPENDDDDEHSTASDSEAEVGKNARCRHEVRRWSHGSYTLLHDEETKDGEYSLDAQLYFQCDNWDLEAGGFTSYISKDADEELLTVEPCSNCLALVYSDKETLHFVKHINARSKENASSASSRGDSCFYDIYTVYLE